MFLGHHAAAFAAKRLAPRTSLGTLVAAATLLDLIWPILLLLGLEHVRVDPGNTRVVPLDFFDYPITHSLATVILWSLGFAIVYWLLRRDARGSVIVALAVVSHWVLDFITHRPDLPLWPGGPKVGLELWRSLPLTAVVEYGLFAAGIAMYVRTTKARDRTGTIALWVLVVFVALVYVANVLGPPPPSPRLVAIGALAAWLFVPWAAWIDRHREARS